MACLRHPTLTRLERLFRAHELLVFSSTSSPASRLNTLLSTISEDHVGLKSLSFSFRSFAVSFFANSAESINYELLCRNTRGWGYAITEPTPNVNEIFFL